MIPLTSFIEPANIHEGQYLPHMVQQTWHDLSLHIDIIVGDMGYISSEQKMKLREQFHAAVLTRVRENMHIPDEYSSYGRPECPEGIPLLWDGYNHETRMHCYIRPPDNSACFSCRLNGNCYQEIYVRPSIDEHHFGIIPLHTKVSQRLLQEIRPQVERGFENDKNKLSMNKLSMNKFFINSLKLARIIGHLADACQVLLLFADMKTNTKSKAMKVLKQMHSQSTLDF